MFDQPNKVCTKPPIEALMNTLAAHASLKNKKTK
jgi:hypothetical protein